MKLNIITKLFFVFFITNAYGQKEYKTLPTKYQVNNSNLSELKEEINNLAVYELVNALPKNHVEDASVDYTDIIQHVINTQNNIAFPNFPILINEKGLSLKSDSKLIFKEKSLLVLKPNNLRSYSIISIKNKKNIKMYFPKIRGDRKKHLSKDGEWGMGISIYGSDNIKIINPQISECWGDGIYVSNTQSSISNNILIQSPLLDYNRRNGLTIVGGKNITISSPIVSNTIGNNPMSGIDIEPNKNGGIVDDIIIKDFISFNNGNSGFQVGLSRSPDNKDKEINILVSNFISDLNPYGIILGGFYTSYDNNIKKINGNIVLKNVTLNNSLKENIKIGRNYHFGPNIRFENVSFNTNSQADIMKLDSFKTKLKKHSQIKLINE